MIECFVSKRSVNFVDSSNVVVGYELETTCSEYPYWVAKWAGQEVSSGLEPADLPFPPDAVFDTGYFESGSCKDAPPADGYSDGVGWARFRVVDKTGAEGFLVLCNEQNGYYSHGFILGVRHFVMHREGEI